MTEKQINGNWKQKDQLKVIPKGTEHILLVDDEKSAVSAMKQILERFGYKITGKSSSVEALDIFRDSPESYDLIITDMAMPKMIGKELASELRILRPDIPIILCTGFSDQMHEKEARTMGINAFIMKPIIMSKFAKIIRDVLDKK